MTPGEVDTTEKNLENVLTTWEQQLQSVWHLLSSSGTFTFANLKEDRQE